jgi:hydroxyacylglutathione hydrolase
MWRSLSKLAVLPRDTAVYCAHEYTQSNARFAVTMEGGNQQLQERKKAIDEARSKVGAGKRICFTQGSAYTGLLV